MATTFHFELVSPERLLFSGEVEAVKLPGAEGEFVVMAGHAPLLALLGPGLLEVTGGSEAVRRLFIDGGFCDVNAGGCTVLAEAAVGRDDLAAGRMTEIIAEAETRAARLSGADRDEADRRLATLRTAGAAL